MGSSHKFLVPVLLLVANVTMLAQNPTYKLGRPPSEEELKAWDIGIDPEGKGLPPGSGVATQGAEIFARKCMACHGQKGAGIEGGAAPRLVGGIGTLQSSKPIRTVGSYWPFATEIWDFIRRAMPMNQEGTLQTDEVYALTAAILYWNGIIQENDVVDAKSLPKVKMPNREGYIPPPISEWKPGMPRPFKIIP